MRAGPARHSGGHRDRPGRDGGRAGRPVRTQARLRAEELFGQLWRNTDSPDAALARRVLSGRYLWLEDGVIDPSIPGPLIAEAEPGPAKTENVHRRII